MADTDQVLKLAAIIREVNGDNSKGAAALAESILNHPSFCECYQLTPPADGEVAKVAAELSNCVAAYKCCHNHDHIWSLIGGNINARLTVTLLTRAAELLLQQALVPVSVSERPPRPGDCNADGRCWLGTPGSDVMEAYWVFRKWAHRRKWDTHWLPAHALPIPQQQEINND